MMMTTSGHGTGGSSSPDSADFGRAGTPELGDELGELVPILDSVHMTPHKLNFCHANGDYRIDTCTHKYTSLLGHSERSGRQNHGT
ncbi:unnamed protein product [Echinostoma caproni]|uniref:Aryl hydrocarbon receptor nuclear translocator-like protein 1 n=1 Tax=Echinostoma caproni TaxID=27848 RepID=A0A183AMX2_9TREM|nr:unnamed protein product [Echinostoma caproni]